MIVDKPERVSTTVELGGDAAYAPGDQPILPTRRNRRSVWLRWVLSALLLAFALYVILGDVREIGRAHV